MKRQRRICFNCESEIDDDFNYWDEYESVFVCPFCGKENTINLEVEK